MQYKGIIFDFDGTLAKLTIDFEKIKKKIIALADIFFDELDHGVIKEYPLLELIEFLTDNLKKTSLTLAKEFNTRCRLLLVDMELRAARGGKLFPFTMKVISNLRHRNIKIGVISRNCTPAIKMVFPDIDKVVDVFLPREDVDKVKPHPNHIIKATQRMGIKKDYVLMVGDHPMDILCAKSGGVDVAAVCSGNVSCEELKNLDPEFLAKDIYELYKILDQKKCI